MGSANDNPRKREGLWLDRASCAAMLGVTSRHFDESVRPRLVDGAERREGKGGRELRFWGPDVVAAWVGAQTSRLRDELRQAKEALAAGDPLLAGGGEAADAARVEYTRVKTAQERIRLAEMEERSVPLEELEPALAASAAVLRRAGETIARKWGNDAGRVHNEAADEWAAACEKLLNELRRNRDRKSTPKPGDGPGAARGRGDEDAGAADDAPVR